VVAGGQGREHQGRVNATQRPLRLHRSSRALDAQRIELALDVTEYEIRPRHLMIVLTHIRNGPTADLKSVGGLPPVSAQERP